MSNRYIARIPNREPNTDPFPPKIEVPPISTAVMTSSGALRPASGIIALILIVNKSPAKAEISPLKQYAKYLIRLVYIPDKSAVFSFPPVAKICLPIIVFLSRIMMIIAVAIRIKKRLLN